MIKNNNKKVLVVFGSKFPKKSKKWYEQFDRVLAAEELQKFINPGNARQACELLDKLPDLISADGRTLSKLVNYQGYELWWMRYDSIYSKFCLPYTQYAGLLSYLKDFESVYLFQPPHPQLFRYFLKAYRRRVVILKKPQLKNLLPLPLGIFIQIILSAVFLLWLKITKPQLMIWASDKFDPPHDFDFRHRFVYQELRRKQIPFVEFIRSLEGWSVILRHAWQRKRPVFYSAAIIEVLQFFTRKLNQPLPSFSSPDPEQRFWFLVAVSGFGNIKGTILAIRMIRFVLRWIGVKVAYISVGCSRTFHEILACKLEGIKTVGILHGAGNRYYDIYDFMPSFNGDKPLSVDIYGLWSNWWKEYFLSYGRAYKPDQLYVSGPMRPLEKETVFKKPAYPLKVLFISEDMAAPQQVLPYFLALLEEKDLELYFKFRPYRDGFELQLKKNQPELYKKIIKNTKILRGTMEEAISNCDVVVGSYSTAVLEALMQLKPAIFFWTDKLGDVFEIRSWDTQGRFFAQTPKDLINCVRQSINISEEDLRKLRERFFGDPHQNGSQWVVEQVEALLKFPEQK